MSKLLVALVFVGLNLYTYSYFANEDFIPERESFESFPLAMEPWSCRARQDMEDDVIQILGVTDYMIRPATVTYTGTFADAEVDVSADVSALTGWTLDTDATAEADQLQVYVLFGFIIVGILVSASVVIYAHII